MSAIGLKLRTVIAGGVLLVAAGCSAQYRNHGYVPTDQDLSNIIVGVDTRDSVAETIGTPTTGGVVKDGSFYYVQSRVKQLGFRQPEVVERQVLAISFDNRGVVRNIERFGLQDGNVVQLSRRVTESSVSDKGFLRQLLGNLGRFSASDFIE
ncbi:outer membrane protein assembly factor BamE [Thalassovita sp.]|uniref:outer membrane protein assembly factor BamE n=1 Tax=Thalassovita sp. TaxID=1979401 RepID=UPI0029DE7620|nr:outer membrane protein assembly factor BamE [Thalassovita sp.]